MQILISYGHPLVAIVQVTFLGADLTLNAIPCMGNKAGWRLDGWSRGMKVPLNGE